MAQGAEKAVPSAALPALMLLHDPHCPPLMDTPRRRQVNGEATPRQHGSPANMIFDLPTLIEAVRARCAHRRSCGLSTAASGAGRTFPDLRLSSLCPPVFRARFPVTFPFLFLSLRPASHTTAVLLAAR